MLRVSTAVRNAGLDAQFDRVDQGSGGPGQVILYQGTYPNTADDPMPWDAVELARFTLPMPAFNPASNGVKELNITSLSAVTTSEGAPSWASMVDGDGAVIFIGQAAPSSADFVTNAVFLATGDTVNLVVGSITDPAT